MKPLKIAYFTAYKRKGNTGAICRTYQQLTVKALSFFKLSDIFNKLCKESSA